MQAAYSKDLFIPVEVAALNMGMDNSIHYVHIRDHFVNAPSQ